MLLKISSYRSNSMRRVTMEKAKEILRLSGSGMTLREIAGASSGCSLGTVHMVLAKVKEAGIIDPLYLSSKELWVPCCIPLPRGGRESS
jgi:hypothetical protein